MDKKEETRISHELAERAYNLVVEFEQRYAIVINGVTILRKPNPETGNTHEVGVEIQD